MDYERIRDIVHPILNRELGHFGYRTMEVFDEEDSNGIESLAILAKYGDGAAEPEPRVSLQAALAVKQALYAAGESKTVHLYHVLPSDADSLPSET
jgi:hypothetical protein